MSKMRCRCGRVLSNSAVPNDVEHWLISDRLADVVDAGRAPAPADADDLPADQQEATSFGYPLRLHADEVWKCSQCGRLHVFADRSSSIATAVYRLDDP